LTSDNPPPPPESAPDADKKPVWRVTPSVSSADDPLLNCLSLLCKLLDRPQSREALAAGLPMAEQGMSPALFIRAANRAGIAARLLVRELSKITPLLLPCVLLMRERKACVLVGITATHAEIMLPETGGVQQIALAELQAQYANYVIFAKPEFRFDPRAQGLEVREKSGWFWGTLRRFRSMYAEVAFASLMINLFALASPLFVMNVYDRVIPNNAMETLWVLASGAIIVFVFDFIIRSLRAYFLDLTGRGADTLISSQLFEQLMGMRMAYRPPSAGALAGHLREFEHLREFYTSASLVTLVDLPFLLLYILVIAIIGGWLAVVPLVAVPLIMGVAFYMQRPLNRIVRETFRESSQKNALLVESITGLETIKKMGAEGYMQRLWENFVGKTSQSAMHAHTLSAAVLNFTTFANYAVTVSLVIMGAYLVAAGTITTGALIASVILAGRATAPLGQIASLLTRFYQSKSALETLDEFMHLPTDRPVGKSFLSRPHLRGQIEFRNVTFAYPGQRNKALQQCQIRIEPGEKIGIIGPIGSGKTTLEKLVLGLYDPDEGSVTLDGTDVRQIDPADLRRNIGVCPQDVFLFYGTIKDNILMGRTGVDDRALLMAGTMAGVTDFVRHHPLGYDLNIGERGEGLSGGQRQAIALARALLLDPPILILDEPTSAMDPGSENRIKSRLAQVIRDKTVIVVTHRASMLSIVDRLIVMTDGKVALDGPKDQVLAQLKDGEMRNA
jgi:ATP-binding cassette, subfamily C, bacterial LapB